MEIANTLEGIEFVNPTANEIKYLEDKSQTKQNSIHTFYKLKSKGSDYYIGATLVIIDINDSELFETNMEFTSNFKPKPDSFSPNKSEF